MREKLVRDGIPDIIKQNDGKEANIRIVDGQEYKNALIAKLNEEVAELAEDPSAEEAGDVLEALYAFCKAYDIDIPQVEEARALKAQKRGGFKEGIMLALEE